MEIAPFTESQARLAREAFKRYGKGRHPAKLLFKGSDFSETDVAVAPY
jgi:uncharacterized protein with PIN domain